MVLGDGEVLLYSVPLLVDRDDDGALEVKEPLYRARTAFDDEELAKLPKHQAEAAGSSKGHATFVLK